PSAAGAGTPAAGRGETGGGRTAPGGQPQGATDRDGSLPAGNGLPGRGSPFRSDRGRGGGWTSSAGEAHPVGHRPVPARSGVGAEPLLGPPATGLVLPGTGQGGRISRGPERLRGLAAQRSLGVQRARPGADGRQTVRRGGRRPGPGHPAQPGLPSAATEPGGG